VRGKAVPTPRKSFPKKETFFRFTLAQSKKAVYLQRSNYSRRKMTAAPTAAFFMPIHIDD
jgi:hypothetical protein